MKKEDRLKKAIAYLKGEQLINSNQDVINAINGNKSNFSSALKGDEKYLTEAFIKRIIDKYPILSFDYINSEKGSMLVEGNIKNKTGFSYTKSPAGKLPKRTGGKGLVQFYDVDFAAGDIEFYNDINSIRPAYEMDIPEFNGCIAFRTYGDSMESLIVNGSILFATQVVDWRSHLEYGQIYGIVMNDKRKYLKYIRKSKHPETHFLLRSENEAYDDFEIPKDKIKGIWLIHGWINKKV